MRENTWTYNIWGPGLYSQQSTVIHVFGREIITPMIPMPLRSTFFKAVLMVSEILLYNFQCFRKKRELHQLVVSPRLKTTLPASPPITMTGESRKKSGEISKTNLFDLTYLAGVEEKDDLRILSWQRMPLSKHFKHARRIPKAWYCKWMVLRYLLAECNNIQHLWPMAYQTLRKHSGIIDALYNNIVRICSNWYRNWLGCGLLGAVLRVPIGFHRIIGAWKIGWFCWFIETLYYVYLYVNKALPSETIQRGMDIHPSFAAWVRWSFPKQNRMLSWKKKRTSDSSSWRDSRITQEKWLVHFSTLNIYPYTFSSCGDKQCPSVERNVNPGLINP